MASHLARLAVLCMLSMAAGCASIAQLEPPDVQVTSLQLLEATPGSLEQRFAVGLRLINPNNRAISLQGLDFELDVNGQRLARGVSDKAFELPRLGEAETSVIVTTSLLDVLRQAVGLSSRRDANLDYRLRGRLHLGEGFVRTVPFNHFGTLQY